MYNKTINRENGDTEMMTLTGETHLVRHKSRPFDWFICSVTGCFLCPWIGMCAMYYAIRANYAVDWDKNDEWINNYTRKAKILSLTSISIGAVICVIYIIIMISVSVRTARSFHH